MGDRQIYDSEALRQTLERLDMNRARGLWDYDELLGTDIAGLARSAIERKGSFVWYDMCCGSFEAGRDLISELSRKDGEESGHSVVAVGIDVDTPLPDPTDMFGTVLVRGSAATHPLPAGIDLITCVRGLRYIQQYQRLGAHAIQRWYGALPRGGVLAFDYVEGTIPVGSVDLPDYLQHVLGGLVQVEHTKLPLKFESALAIRMQRVEHAYLNITGAPY